MIIKYIYPRKKKKVGKSSIMFIKCYPVLIGMHLAAHEPYLL